MVWGDGGEGVPGPAHGTQLRKSPTQKEEEESEITVTFETVVILSQREL